MVTWLALSLVPTIAWTQKPPNLQMIVTDLRCESQSEPLGIDSTSPRLSWILKADASARNVGQTSYRIIVASSFAVLGKNRGDLWDSGKITSKSQNNIAYEGMPLKTGQVCHWKVAVSRSDGKPIWSRPGKWEMGILGESGWIGKWINDGKKNSGSDQDFYLTDPTPLFRKEFKLKGPVARARLYITGLGYYEPYLNGKRVGDHVLDPGWTRFEKRTLYSVFDVSTDLQTGNNCLGVMLGNGWYNPLPLKLFGRFNLRNELAVGRPRLIAQLQIQYKDGSSETVATDETWKVGEGAILRNDIYLGEIYDANKEQPDWNRVGFRDSQWKKVAVSDEKLGPLVAQSQPPIRVTAKWSAVKVTEPKPGVFIYDMGVNFSGWAQFKLSLEEGTTLKIRYGELLYKDGSLNPMTSVAGQIKGNRQGTSESVGGPGAPKIAWQTDTYIARGGGETYTPRFTFHGFRYIEITGLPAPLPLSAVTANRLNSDVEEVGTFSCSDPWLNDIQAMCKRTFLSNIFSVQSDCPHRERLGYGGDIVATSEAMMCNFDMSGFYEKTVRDWSDSALPDGMFTDTAPYMGINYCGVIWAMAHPLLANQLHQYYGNARIGKEEYAAAKRWLVLVEKKYPTGIVTDGLSDHESLEPTPSPDLVTPLFFESAKLLAAMANRLALKADEAYFLKMAEKIRNAYQSKFIDSVTGKVGIGTQASQATALHTSIVSDKDRPKVLDYLLADIKKRNGKLTTGILGTKFMLDVLSREGHVDVAYNIVSQPDFPGWRWMLRNGATTLWEHWEFSDNTYSHNHPMFGSVSQWMMNWLGGIQPESNAVGFDKIVIQPKTPGDLKWVKSSYRSVRGEIISNWSREGNLVRYEFVVPPNVLARVKLPAHSTTDMNWHGPLEFYEIKRGRGFVEYTLGSGHYKVDVVVR